MDVSSRSTQRVVSFAAVIWACHRARCMTIPNDGCKGDYSTGDATFDCVPRTTVDEALRSHDNSLTRADKYAPSRTQFRLEVKSD